MIDSSIAMGFRTPEVQDPLNAMARVMQVQAAQQQNQLGAMKADEYRTGVERKNKLNAILGGFAPDATPDAISSALVRGGYLDEAKSFTESTAKASKDKRDGEKTGFDLAKDRYSTYQKTAGALFNDPQVNKPKVLQAVSGLVTAGVLQADMAERLAASLPDDPAALRQALRQAVATQLTPEQMLTAFAPKAEKIDNGQQIGFRDTNPNSPTYGQATAGAAVQKQQTPDSAASVAATIRGQNLTDSRAREGNNLQREAARQQVIESSDGFSLVDKATGTVRPLVGADGKPLGPKLKDAPAAVQSAVISNATNLARAERALSLVQGKTLNAGTPSETKGDTAATGLKGFLPNQALNRIDPAGVDTRAAIADLGSLVIHDRSGAAVTAAEFPRLAPFIPNEKDDRATAEKKLKRFVQVYRDELSALQSAYGPDTGYRAPGGKVAAPAAPAKTPTVTNW